MTTIQEIEKAIEALPRSEVVELAAWFEEFEAQLWDEQVRSDAASGRFAELRKEAFAEQDAGATREL